MPSSAEQKMEKFWQEFERTGSIQAYLKYQALKLAMPSKSKTISRRSKPLASSQR